LSGSIPLMSNFELGVEGTEFPRAREKKEPAKKRVQKAAHLRSPIKTAAGLKVNRSRALRCERGDDRKLREYKNFFRGKEEKTGKKRRYIGSIIR